MILARTWLVDARLEEIIADTVDVDPDYLRLTLGSSHDLEVGFKNTTAAEYGGVDAFLTGCSQLALEIVLPQNFNARLYWISDDSPSVTSGHWYHLSFLLDGTFLRRAMAAADFPAAGLDATARLTFTRDSRRGAARPVAIKIDLPR